MDEDRKTLLARFELAMNIRQKKPRSYQQKTGLASVMRDLFEKIDHAKSSGATWNDIHNMLIER